MQREELPFLCKKNNMIGVEIGVEYAPYSKYLLKTGLFNFFYCVDSWDDTFYDVLDGDGNPLKLTINSDLNYEIAKSNLNEFDNVITLRKPSIDAVNDFEDGYFDFIYIDSNHTYDNVLMDVSMWWSKLKVGGMMCGDDYIDGYDDVEYNNKKYKAIFGVKSAIDCFCSIMKLSINVIYPTDRYPNWYIIK